MKTEVPQIRIVVVRLPSLDAGKKGVHNNPNLWHFRFHGPTPEVPQIRIVVVRLPSLDAGKKGVHYNKLLHFSWIHRGVGICDHQRSEEHTSELQSQSNLVCRLLLEKKKKKAVEQCL